MKYILYKHPIQKDTLAIVQYLHARGILLLPLVCIERNHPDWVTELPSIETEHSRYKGLKECIEFYEQQSGICGILALAKEFKEQKPEYCIHS
jgi:hypothetical protein